MRIAQINMVDFGSTGKIMFGIAEVGTSLGHEMYTFSPLYYAKGKRFDAVKKYNHIYFGSVKESLIHYIIGEVAGLQGYGSFFGTKQLINKLEKLKPDILHLHNLHNYSINIPMLFSYIKKEKIKTVWTLHDCWAITGKCPYFTISDCKKWVTGCNHCPVLREYPKLYFDLVGLLWKKKRKWFSEIPNMTIVTPSQWLANIVNESFLSSYPIIVINNGINAGVFQPCKKTKNNIYNINYNKHIVLGVALDWGKRKGLDVFIELSKALPDKYQIVLTGTSETIDKMLPSNIISIHRTQNQHELAELYSAASVFVNPTREDNFPTVNLEALACGTPVVTFDTGGSPEAIDSTCGYVVKENNINDLKEKIEYICEEKPFSEYDCVHRAQLFDAKEKYKQYIQLYINIFSNKP